MVAKTMTSPKDLVAPFEEEVELKRASQLFETQVVVLPAEQCHDDHVDHGDDNSVHADHADNGKHGDVPLTC